MALIVAGGLGFLTLAELRRAARDRYAIWRKGDARVTQLPPLTAHTRIVLGSTAVLLVGGWALFAWIEWGGALAGMSSLDRIVNGLFRNAFV